MRFLKASQAAQERPERARLILEILEEKKKHEGSDTAKESDEKKK